MAKPVTQKIKLVSTAGTGYYYVTKKNPRTSTEKLVFKKYGPGAPLETAHARGHCPTGSIRRDL